LREAYAAEEIAERQRAKKEEAVQTAAVLVAAEIDKKKIEILAEAEAEKVRRLKRGEADGIRLVMEAQAEGQRLILEKKAEALGKLIEVTGGQPQAAAQLLITDMMPRIIEAQAKAISNIKIDKVTVWDTGRGADGKSSTANFLSGMLGALPPLHEVARQAGLELPNMLGTMPEGVVSGAGAHATASSAASESQSPWQRAYNWALSNHQQLLAYDTNKDGKLSVDDVSVAVGKAIRWSRLVEDTTVLWSFSDGKNSAKGMAWSAIAALPANPATMVSLSSPASDADAGSLPVSLIQAIRSV